MDPQLNGDTQMKYFKRLKVYKSKNVIYNPETGRSTSYDWWNLTQRISGVLVLNEYKYSVTTAKHIDKVYCTLKDTGTPIGLEVTSPYNLELHLYGAGGVIRAIKWQLQELDRVLTKHHAPKARTYSGAANDRRFEIARMAKNLVNLHKLLDLVEARSKAAEVAADRQIAK